MAGLSDEAMLMLTKLDQARIEAEAHNNESLGWVDLSRHPKQNRASLIRYGLMKKDSSIPNVYRITPKGQEALMVGFRPKDESRLDIVKPEIRDAIGANPTRCPDSCAECIYWQAVDILAKKVPGVLELMDALRTIDARRR